MGIQEATCFGVLLYDAAIMIGYKDKYKILKIKIYCKIKQFSLFCRKYQSKSLPLFETLRRMEWLVTKLIGLTLNEFRTVANIIGLQWRVAKVGDEGLPITSDLNLSRLNLHLRNGIITEITFG